MATVRTMMLVAASAAAVAAAGDDASAGPRWRDGEPDHVVALSRHGNGSIAAPVRATRTGYQVRLPRGTWVGCRTSCAETLRVETIDIFETEGRLSGYGSMQNECGIFGCLDVRYRW